MTRLTVVRCRVVNNASHASIVVEGPHVEWNMADNTCDCLVDVAGAEKE
jgi:hypothetical protein